MFMTMYGVIILIVNSFQGCCTLGGIVHISCTNNGSVLILDPKTKNSFKVNGFRLKPYIGKEGPPPIYNEELQLLEISATN